MGFTYINNCIYIYGIWFNQHQWWVSGIYWWYTPWSFRRLLWKWPIHRCCFMFFLNYQKVNHVCEARMVCHVVFNVPKITCPTHGLESGGAKELLFDSWNILRMMSKYCVRNVIKNNVMHEPPIWEWLTYHLFMVMTGGWFIICFTHIKLHPGSQKGQAHSKLPWGVMNDYRGITSAYQSLIWKLYNCRILPVKMVLLTRPK